MGANKKIDEETRTESVIGQRRGDVDRVAARREDPSYYTYRLITC